eukprot:CFRG7620T1
MPPKSSQSAKSDITTKNITASDLSSNATVAPVAPAAKPLPEEVKTWLEEHANVFEVLPTGKLQCKVTKHELPGRIDLIEMHLNTRKYILASKRAAVVIPDKYKDIIVTNEKKNKQHMLFCVLTRRSFMRTPEELDTHLNGRRFKNKYAKHIAQLAREAEEAAAMECSDDDKVIQDEQMFLNMVESGNESGTESESESESESENESDSEMTTVPVQVAQKVSTASAPKQVNVKAGVVGDKNSDKREENTEKINNRKRKLMNSGKKRKNAKV